MGYRYCPKCDKWLETFEYTVSDSGETICPDHGIATHGFIDGSPFYGERDLKRDHPLGTYRDRQKLIEAARRQDLI